MVSVILIVLVTIAPAGIFNKKIVFATAVDFLRLYCYCEWQMQMYHDYVVGIPKIRRFD